MMSFFLTMPINKMMPIRAMTDGGISANRGATARPGPAAEPCKGLKSLQLKERRARPVGAEGLALREGHLRRANRSAQMRLAWLIEGVGRLSGGRDVPWLRRQIQCP